MVFITTYCWPWCQLLPSLNLPESLALHFLYIKLCPFINKQFIIDSFLDWKGNQWVFSHLKQHTRYYFQNEIDYSDWLVCPPIWATIIHIY